jgi:hypothetical protein
MKILILSIAVMLSLLVSCNQPPSPQSKAASSLTTSSSPSPTVQPTPTLEPDLPKISGEETAALIWNKLPDMLTEGYQKSQFSSITGNATYQEKGKWKYSVSGAISHSSLLPTRNLEKTPDYWVENHSQEVTTQKLLLNAEYFETTNTLNIQNIQISDEIKSVETLGEWPITAKKVKVSWITGTSTGYELRVEGSVANTGILPLENAIFEVTTYNNGGILVRTDSVNISSPKLNPGDNCKFFLVVSGAALKGSDPNPSGYVIFGRFTYRFLLPSGKEIFLEKS